MMDIDFVGNIISRTLKTKEAGLWLDPDLAILAEEVKRLREKCNMQANILRSLTPDKYPDTLFIHAQLGEKDQNGMPEKLMVVPAYGVDFSYVYERTDKTVGPEW